jgi:Holliday junction resolvase RusA-like endonuclease
MSSDIVLDLPVPPSVNRTRRVDWRSMARRADWEHAANTLALLNRKQRKITGKFEVLITLSERHTRMDLDNCVKELIDYARKIELITNDSPKYMRRIVVDWGHAPEGVRLTLREVAP